MTLVVASKDAHGNDGCVYGVNCHPSGLRCGLTYISVELCIDLTASVYEAGGFKLDVYSTTLECVKMGDCILGPNDPYNEPYTPDPSISLLLVPDPDDPTFDPRLAVYVNGVEAEDGWSAPEGTPCVWVRLYGLR